MTRRIQTLKTTSLKTTSLIGTPLVLTTALLLTALASAPARAQFTIALAPVAPVFSSTTDQTVTFSATLTNSYAYPLYLNGDFFIAPAAPLSVDDDPFFSTFVLPAAPLAAGGVTSTDLFTVLIPAGTPVNGYDGTFYVTGGPDALATQALATAAFHLDVEPVPEASTTVSLGLLLTLGLGGLIIAARRRKTAEKARG